MKEVRALSRETERNGVAQRAQCPTERLRGLRGGLRVMVSKRTAQGKVAYLEKKKNRYLVAVSRGLVYRSLSLVQIALTPRKKET